MHPVIWSFIGMFIGQAIGCIALTITYRLQDGYWIFDWLDRLEDRITGLKLYQRLALRDVRRSPNCIVVLPQGAGKTNITHKE